jgi:hypothetical protein
MRIADFLKPGRRSRATLVAVALVWVINQILGVGTEVEEVRPLVEQLLDAMPEIGAWLSAWFFVLKGERIEAKASE